jgi:hypothetical protein
MIYRLAEIRDWEAAQASGYFVSVDLTGLWCMNPSVDLDTR